MSVEVEFAAVAPNVVGVHAKGVLVSASRPQERTPVTEDFTSQEAAFRLETTSAVVLAEIEAEKFVVEAKSTVSVFVAGS